MSFLNIQKNSRLRSDLQLGSNPIYSVYDLLRYVHEERKGMISSSPLTSDN